jgi:acylphosphatase
MADKARVLLHIYGRVQGVFFRVETHKKAISLHLTGWVRNNSDGSVQSVAEGDKKRLTEFIFWCEQGPPAASVDKVDVEWLPYTGEFEDFISKH